MCLEESLENGYFVPMRKLFGLFYAFSLLSLFPFVILAKPVSFVEKADEISNICQSCYPKIVRWGGKPHCAPAAFSNSLVWLSTHGYPALQPYHDSAAEVAQARLVDHLGEVMGTSEKAGTSPSKALAGLKRYMEMKQVPYIRIASTGWRTVPDFVKNDGPLANLDWIKEGILAKGSVWILIGWCRYNPNKDNCEIYDGHWMTVVGYGKDRSGHEDPSILIVHDPAERAERKNYYPKLIPLQSGTIDNSVHAKGVFKLTGDIIIKPSADFGVIQGAYRLEL